MAVALSAGASVVPDTSDQSVLVFKVLVADKDVLPIFNVPLNSAVPSLATLKFFDPMAPLLRVILIPALVKSDPSEVPLKLPEEITPVVILPPSIVVLPLEPKSPATSAVVLPPDPSTKVFVPLNFTKPTKFVAVYTVEPSVTVVPLPPPAVASVVDQYT